MTVARTRMTMRATVKRRSASTTDAWGQPDYGSYATVVESLPCFVYSRERREREDGDKAATIQTITGMFTLDADIAEGDRISQITDRRGSVLYTGDLDVGPIQYKHGHVEARLERIT